MVVLLVVGWGRCEGDVVLEYRVLAGVEVIPQAEPAV